MAWSHLFLGALLFVASVFLLRYFLAPLVIEGLTRLRIHAVSFHSIRGIEWRPKNNPHQLHPTLRIDRIALSWAKPSEKVTTGWFTVRVEGLTLRMNGLETFRPRGPNDQTGVESDYLSSQSEEETANIGNLQRLGQGSNHRQSKLKGQLRLLASYVIGLAVNHSPWLARLVDFELVNCRVLLVGTEGVTLAIASLRTGLAISFDNVTPSAPRGPGGLPTTPPTSSLFSPPATPFTSPTGYFSQSHGIGSLPPHTRATKGRSSGRLHTGKLSNLMSGRAGRM